MKGRRIDMIGPAFIVLSGILGFAVVVVLLACAVIGLSARADADPVYSWGGDTYQSTVTLQRTEAPGAVAEVVFLNRTVHQDKLETFVLDLDGLAVTVDALVGRVMTPDRLTITPPQGFIAVPPEIDVPENETGVVLILPWVGM